MDNVESKDKITQQSKATKFFKLLVKLFIASIVLVIISVIIYSGPLPFNQQRWEAYREQRYRMLGSVSRRISGLSLDDVQEILGSPYLIGYRSNRLSISYSSPRPGQQWLHIIIIFNEDGVVESVWRGNPAHFSLGG